jgi:hypothetical protein
MAKLGFTYYDEPVVQPVPTVAEMMAALTNDQKIAILNGFTAKKKPNIVKHELSIPQAVVVAIYKEIDRIEETARLLMREEVVLEDATFDEDGNMLTEPVYNDAPTSITELKAELAPNFTESFTVAQVGAIVDRMIAYSKADGSGDAAYYQSQVVL